MSHHFKLIIKIPIPFLSDNRCYFGSLHGVAHFPLVQFLYRRVFVYCYPKQLTFPSYYDLYNTNLSIMHFLFFFITHKCYIGNAMRSFINRNGTAVNAATMFARGSGPILLENLQCSGTEDSLADCRHDGWGMTYDYCSHGRDSGVICGK